MILIRVTVLLLVFQCYSFLSSINFVRQCTAPNDSDGHCVSLFECLPSLKILATLKPAAILYVKSSICLGYDSKRFMVCCEDVNKTTNETINFTLSSAEIPITNRYVEVTNVTNLETIPLLPSRKYCGYQHNDDRYFNENVTAIDEFPWLVHIKATFIKEEYKFGDRCSGVIINKRYILTDWSCGAKALKVRLGQYNTGKNITCTAYNANIPECTEPTIEVLVEERVFMNNPTNSSYSLVLLRLNKTMVFTDFVRPICLPIDEIDERDPEQLLTFSGWGASWIRAPSHIVKKRLNYEMTLTSECYEFEDELENEVKTSNVTINCLLPHQNNTNLACNGDHGGPLMYHKKKKQWFIEGVIVKVYPDSFNYCNTKDFPISSIRITEYVIKWILNGIRP